MAEGSGCPGVVDAAAMALLEGESPLTISRVSQLSAIMLVRIQPQIRFKRM